MSNTIKLTDSNYAQEILSYYLWGQATPPESNKIADEKWISKRRVGNLLPTWLNNYFQTT